METHRLVLDMYMTAGAGVLALLLGVFFTRTIPLLKRLCIPAPVSGGLAVSLLTLAVHAAFRVDFAFDGTVRDLCMILFFTSVGFQSNLRVLREGGKPLLVMIALVAVLIVVFLSCARWYKNHDAKSEAPKGFVGAMEMVVMTIHDDLIKSSIGEKHYKPYAPYLLTVFFFILTCNLIGLIPVFPGGANVTGNINITFFLAVCTMLAINIFANKEYWKEIFWPEVPLFLKAYPAPVMPLIELFGVFTKPFALMIRLFANMMAGHAVILSFTCVIFLGWSMGVGFGLGLNAFSIIMLLFMNALELLVAFVQAYVFTMLSAVFIGLAHKEHHAE